MADLRGNLVPVAEEKGYAPQSCQTHEGENDSAEGGSLSAEKPAHKVELEQADRAPVQRADDNQYQRCSVKHFVISWK